MFHLTLVWFSPTVSVVKEVMLVPAKGFLKRISASSFSPSIIVFISCSPTPTARLQSQLKLALT